MAASDPTIDVATPTGTLQGVAAFSWDGTAWQPSGRAGPAVATPTGALQGVAPFSWSGSAWTPAGRAQPGIATPSGVLDGVAVYTWSGSAWTPTGGTATTATPTGALRGVAAFSWDGAAWQPAAQARASVPTPYGVLDGVAMFNWTGSFWDEVPGTALDLSFMTPGALDPRVTFARASTATYFDSSGTMQTAATNAPRFDYDPVSHALRGLLLEEARTNLLLNSATLGTQSVTVTNQIYALSFYGTGTITMSGAFAGSLVGAGAFPNRATTTFTPAAGTLTLTVTGSVLNAQLEAGAFPTSYIPTTGAAVTRAVDLCSIPPANMSWFVPPGGSWAVEFIPFFFTTDYQRAIFQLPDQTSIGPILGDNIRPAHGAQFDGTGLPITTNTMTAGALMKIATTATAALGRVCLNSGAVASGALSGAYPALGTSGIGLMCGSNASQASANMDGYIRRVRYWPRVLSDAELQSVTT